MQYVWNQREVKWALRPITFNPGNENIEMGKTEGQVERGDSESLKNEEQNCLWCCIITVI